MAEHYDLLVRGGNVVDGTGAPARRADVAVSGGRIAAVGEVRGSAARTVEADGMIVAPGFIDLHTHYDAQVLWDRMLTISPWHGVTSVVMGNCGFGIAPTRAEHRELILKTLENVEGMALDALLAGVGTDWSFESFSEYLDAVESRGTAINVAAMVGHTPVRMYVMGEEATERPATEDEVAQMRVLVAGALEAGAIGFATSQAPTHVGYAGRPVPSRAADLAEITELAGCLKEAGHGIMQATVGPGLFIDQLAELARATGRPVTWTALLAGMLGPDGHRSVLEKTAELREQGITVVPQVTNRRLNFEYQFKAPFVFESMSMFGPVSRADHEGKKRIYADPDFRARFRERTAESVIGGDWNVTVISEAPTAPELTERCVAEVARERGVDPVDLVLDLALESDLETRFRTAVLNTDEDVIAELLVDPTVVLGLSDAGAHASQLCDACQATDLLGRWVREKGVLTVEQAVELLTSRNADLLGLADRGRIAPGLVADLAVFDPQTVGCTPLRRVHDLPAGADRLVSEAIGMHAVVVGGTVVREHGADALDEDAPLPGRLLRSGPASTRP